VLIRISIWISGFLLLEDILNGVAIWPTKCKTRNLS